MRCVAIVLAAAACDGAGADCPGACYGDPQLIQGLSFDYATVRFGDFDGDGHMDFLAGGESQGGLVLFHNDGHDAFEPTPLLDFPNASSIAVGDFDGDGRADFVAVVTTTTTNTTSQVVIGLSRPPGFETAVLQLPIGLLPVPGDAGLTDLVGFAGFMSPATAFLEHDTRTCLTASSCTFTVEQLGSVSAPNALPMYVEVGRFGGTRTDLLVVYEAFESQFYFQVAISSDSGYARGPLSALASLPLAISTADLDGDGHDEVLVTLSPQRATEDGHDVEVWGESEGVLSTRQVISVPYAGQIFPAHLSSPTSADVVVASHDYLQTETEIVTFSDDAGTLVQGPTLDVGVPDGGVFGADLDGDGLTDFVVVGQSQLAVLRAK